MLVRGTLLQAAEGGGYVCDLFARTNGHLSGDHLTKEERGNRRSLPERCKQMIAAEAVHQGHLLPPEVFRTRNGELLDRAAVERSMVLIITLDRCLLREGERYAPRHKGTFTQGLVADADWVVRHTPQEHLARFYKWLRERHDHPATPKSAEDVLRGWEATFAVARKMEGF
jgi:hypothetical protein